MLKLSNNKGFTLVEILIAFTMLAVMSSLSFATINNINIINSNNIAAQKAINEYTSTFDSFINGVLTEENYNALGADAVGTRIFSNTYTMFNKLESTSINTTTEFYYNDYEYDSALYTKKENININIISFTKSDNIVGGPSYFVVSSVSAS